MITDNTNWFWFIDWYRNRIFYNNKYFFYNCRFFDLTSKLSLTQKTFEILPKSIFLWFFISSDFEYDEGDALAAFLFNSMKVLTFFSSQQSFLVKTKATVTGSLKKWSSWYVLLAKSSNSPLNNVLSLLFLTFLPFAKNSLGLNKFKFLSSNNGNFSFFIKEIGYFSSMLDETYLDWHEKIYIDVQFKFKNLLKNNNYWFNFLFLKGMLQRVFWSSLGIVCSWGHSGWVANSIIWSENYWILFRDKKKIYYF